MTPRPRRRDLFLSVLSTVTVLCACSGLPSVRFDSPFGDGRWVEFRDGVVVGAPTPAIAGNFANLKDVRLGVRVEIDAIGEDDDCANTFSLGPGETRAYACAQKFVAAGKRYRVDVRVYKDLGSTDLVERVQRIVTLETGDEGELVLVGRPLE
jgi:hypothetical protein